MKPLLAIVCCLFFSFITSPVYAVKKDMSLAADPQFNESNLSPEMRLWYGRLWQVINNPDKYPGVDAAATGGDAYKIGRVVGPYVYSLYDAYRITGDTRLLDEADRVMELTKPSLRDWDGDGIKGWKWLFDPDSGYYGQENHPMDNWLTYSVVAEHLYVLRQNQDLKPEYRQHADFWQDILVNHWEVRMNASSGQMEDKSLFHPYTAATTYHYHMYKLLGDNWRQNSLNQHLDITRQAMKELPLSGGKTGWVWDHRVVAIENNPFGCQPTQYAHLSLLGFEELAWEKQVQFADTNYMSKYANMAAGSVYKDGINAIAGDVCDGFTVNGLQSSGYETEPVTKAALYSGFLNLAFWDESGKLKTSAQQLYDHFDSTGTPQYFHLPVAMMLAQARIEQYGQTASPSPTASPVASPTASPGIACTLADITLDGKVNTFDYTVFLNNFGQPITNTRADITADGKVNLLDYSVLIRCFNKI
jgi:hypothetical protein